jgi:hypothetical protein
VTDSNKELMHRIIYNISKKERMCNEWWKEKNINDNSKS